MSVDHPSAVAAPKSDPDFLHVKPGMTVIVEDGSDWRMADVIWVDGRQKPQGPHAVPGGRRGHGHHQLGERSPRDTHRFHGLTDIRNSAPRPGFIASTGLNAELHQAVERSLQC